MVPTPLMRGHQTWADHTATSRRPPAVQIQENEVMQLTSFCYTVEPALAGIGHFFQDDALELQLFKLEHDILLQAQSLANKHRSSFREERWVMSKENLARFKSADAKLLALQRTKAALD